MKKQINELTSLEKYKILLLGDNSDELFLCHKIFIGINRSLLLDWNWPIIDVSEEFEWFSGRLVYMPSAKWNQKVQEHFHMHIIKPIDKPDDQAIWWKVEDHARQVAWNTLLEYWKNQAYLEEIHKS